MLLRTVRHLACGGRSSLPPCSVPAVKVAQNLRQIMRPTLRKCATRVPSIARRRFTTFAENTGPSQPAKKSTLWKVLKYGSMFALVGTTGMVINEWQGFKEILLLRFYMSEEELEECRESAMKLIQTARDTAVPMSEQQLSDLLSERYYTIAQDRVNSVGHDEYELTKEEARELAWDYVYAMWELDAEDFDLAFLACRYFLIYTPEQLELAVSSPAARQALLDGQLLTDQELRDLAWPGGRAGDEGAGGFGSDQDGGDGGGFGRDNEGSSSWDTGNSDERGRSRADEGRGRFS